MENIIVFVIIAIIGVLQIALFFKIWSMTNDVKDIKYVIDAKSHTNEALIEFLSGNKTKAKELMDKSYYHTIISYCEMSYNPSIKYSHEHIVKLFKEGYDRMELEMPEIDTDQIIKLTHWDK
ncbi:MAG: hypothetical protein ACK5M3_16035 [Dysgonomonas sp.]